MTFVVIFNIHLIHDLCLSYGPHLKGITELAGGVKMQWKISVFVKENQ